MAAFLLINPRSGDARPTAEELRQAAAERGIETHVLGEGDDATELARAAAAEAIGVAGGDGTLASIAAVALERDLPFVCVPFGTRNHFARDVGVDRDDPIGALAAFGGTERRIDIGRAGDRVFLNNVSLGIYARLVHHRRRSEALARLRAFWTLATQRHSLGLSVDGEPTEAKLVLIANNAYALRPFSIGARERLDEGLLHLYVVDGSIYERRGTRFAIDAHAGRLAAAIDGEPEIVETPLECAIEPRALRILVP